MADIAGYHTDAKLGQDLHSNKRKRDTRDQGMNRPAPNMGNADLTDQDTAFHLAAHNAGTNDDMQQFDMHQNGGGNNPSVGDTAAAALAYHQMTVPQATELQFQTQSTGGDGSFNMGDHQQQTSMQDFSLEALKAATQTGRPGQPANSDSPPQSASHKPPVGSDEWHKVRRDNHKEVERRRRETINEGINELAKIVPGCEKNKGSILQRAVQFITQLKENEQQNIEKWTLEKLLTEQAITELSASCDKFKGECQRAWDEAQIYKRACENAGIIPDEIKERENNGEPTGPS
ncbi:basic helix-loop-helix protein [Neodidymelliopsis sp. IMI 364377]|jgi:bHLH factor|nr:basic helix-loop-helix protein [Neodidymelliopsis sp. IMI 364377]